jgi:HPt (histidine-containing phosphotransfer) domain-containing protein
MIDRDAIAQALGFARSDIDMVLELFLHDAHASVKAIGTAIEAKDYAAIANAAHAIKGSAGNFRLAAIYEHTKALEAAARNADAAYDYPAALSRLETLLSEV